jgi:phosphoserine phosphatase RsbU/P
MGTIVLLQNGEAIRFNCAEGETLIGRHPDCAIQLQSNMVSRTHARISKDGDRHVLEDLQSGNGTFVNGRRIAEPIVLQHEDRIKVGPLLLRFEADNSFRTPASSFSSPTSEIDITTLGEHRETATIMGAVESGTGFGSLEVRPDIKLKAVVDISRSLAGMVELESLLPKILDRLFEIFPHADQGCILLRDHTGQRMIPKAVKHRRAVEDGSVKLSRTILNKVLTEKSGILSADAASDAQFGTSESIPNLAIRSMMCAPMLNLAGEPMGVINIDTQNPVMKFTKDDLDLLLAVAGQAALSYENAQLMVTAMEKRKQDADMRIAHRVQEALLPAKLPELAGYRFFASYEAAQAVGGDYYDWMRLDDGRLCLALGDVAGKGVPASLIMSRLSSVVQCTMPFVTDVQDAMRRINNHICSHAADGRFITFVLIILDPATHEMCVGNAGHMSPMIRRADGTVEELDGKTIGVPLGIVEDFVYHPVQRTLQPGETVVIYSDGVSEAMNAASELYGPERLIRTIADGRAQAEDVGQRILQDVKAHAGERPQNDDITLMVFGRD